MIPTWQPHSHRNYTWKNTFATCQSSAWYLARQWWCTSLTEGQLYSGHWEWRQLAFSSITKNWACWPLFQGHSHVSQPPTSSVQRPGAGLHWLSWSEPRDIHLYHPSRCRWSHGCQEVRTWHGLVSNYNPKTLCTFVSHIMVLFNTRKSKEKEKIVGMEGYWRQQDVKNIFHCQTIELHRVSTKPHASRLEHHLTF